MRVERAVEAVSTAGVLVVSLEKGRERNSQMSPFSLSYRSTSRRFVSFSSWIRVMTLSKNLKSRSISSRKRWALSAETVRSGDVSELQRFTRRE